MATTKTIQPTGTTITIPAMSDRPDASVYSTDVDRITDATNALNSSLAYDWNGVANYVSTAETGATGVITRSGKIRSISFQGVQRVHAEDEVFATLPEGDRPSNRVFVTGNIGATCVAVSINSNGEMSIYTLNGATESARLYFGATYIVQK